MENELLLTEIIYPLLLIFAVYCTLLASDPKRAIRMASLRKRTNKDGSVSYRVDVRLKGFPPQRASFRRITDAKRWGQQCEAAIREGRYFKTTEARKHTLAEAIDRYKESVLPAKRDQKKQSAQLDWWRNELGPFSLADVGPASLGEARDKLAKGRAPATVVRYLAALSHVLRRCSQWYMGWRTYEKELK